MIQGFLSPQWEPLFRAQNLHNFDDLWNLEHPWFEEPNYRRGGWSGVMRITLPSPTGEPIAFFLKRQENHTYRSLTHPIRGDATFVREIRNILAFQKHHVPAVEPLFFQKRVFDHKLQAILITKALDHYYSLETVVQSFQLVGFPPLAIRKHFIQTIAQATRQMHMAHLQHNCLYPKHILVKMSTPEAGLWSPEHPWSWSTPPEIDIRFIDLEKARKRALTIAAALHDLSTLNRRSLGWRYVDRLLFLKAYFNIDQLTPLARVVWKQLARRAAYKFAIQQGDKP